MSEAVHIAGEIVDNDAIEIGQLYQKAGHSLVDSVKYQIECGHRLSEKKATMKHGQWLPWLESNTTVEPRMAQNYMMVARRYPELDDANTKRVSHLSLRKAIDYIRQESRREERIGKLVEVSVGTISAATGQQLASVVLADPPWQYEQFKTTPGSVENHYPTMGTSDLCELGDQIRDATTDDAVLFMWVTAPKVTEAAEILEAWGFTYRTSAVWDKQRDGMGHYFRIGHELLFVAVRGAGVPVPEPAFRVSSVFREPRTTHSTKPVCVYEFIEAAYPALTKLELFARQQRPGWIVWGKEANVPVGPGRRVG